ncbi:MAG TPA: ATP-binding protein, partial [Candidatus Kapabacteria bacterium]|nr:ATP-binding protein [Candidatus Kapabacteria bacterium]
DPHNGVTEHFKHVASHIIPRTLCTYEGELTIAEPSDTLVQFDSTMKEISSSVIIPVVDSTSAMVELPGDEGHHLLFSQTQSVILSDDFGVIGITPGGMLYDRTGFARFSGTPLRHSILFCAETETGASLRTEAPNRTWWWFRYRTAGGIVAGAILLFVIIFIATKRYFFYRTYYNQLVRSSTSTGIIALNRQQRVIHINNAARELLNIAPYIPLQRHLTDYIPNIVYTDIVTITRECMQTRKPHEKIIALQEGAQSRTFLCRARPTISRGGILAGCILQIEDITRTIDRERLINWASVAHHIAHEMKTPIGTVLLNAQHLQKTEEEIPDKSRKYLQRIILQTDRLSSILQTFLRIARFNAMNFSTLNIANLVQSLAAEYSDLVPPNITVKYLPSNIDAVTNVDSEQLITALRNIIDNAVNAINPGTGTITISLADRSSSAGDFIVVIIRDDGKGMSETCKARLFEPFYTETPGGSGIGMMIVKRIVDEHKGFIEIESEEGKGTEIRILLPRNPAERQ